MYAWSLPSSPSPSVRWFDRYSIITMTKSLGTEAANVGWLHYCHTMPPRTEDKAGPLVEWTLNGKVQRKKMRWIGPNHPAPDFCNMKRLVICTPGTNRKFTTKSFAQQSDFPPSSSHWDPPRRMILAITRQISTHSLPIPDQSLEKNFITGCYSTVLL